MLPILRRVRWKANVPKCGAVPFRPYAMARKSERAKPPHPSTRTSDKTKSARVSKFTIFIIVLFGITEWSHDDHLRYIARVMSLYHRLTSTLFQPPYLPIRSACEIRLLVLEPGKGSDTIQCRLKHVSLSDNPKYEALSYVWGDPVKLDYIYCNGKRVRIGKELFNALEALREPDRERILWADALCINQNDNVEKGKQVAIMGDIYASCQQVLIWLGKGTSQTASVFKTLGEIGRDLSEPSSGHKDVYLDRLIALSEPDGYQADLPKLSQVDWVSIREFTGHRYFHRVWTLQEEAKAPAATVVYGGQSIPVSDFSRSLSYLTREFSDRAPGFDHTKGAFDNSGKLSDCQPRPYLQMVSSNSPSRGATNPRDRIYAFSSISTDHNISDWELFPDYEASVEEVYSRFARWCLLKKKDLTYLAHAGLPAYCDYLSTQHGPSWVADWTRKKKLDSQSMLSGTIHSFKAGSALDPTVVWKPNQPQSLFIKGRVVDTVAELAVTLEDLDNYSRRSARSSKGQKYELPLWRKYILLLGRPHFVQGLEEAQHAVSKYGPVKGPAYMLREVVWMENCKAIATQGMNTFSTARFDTFWWTMTRNRPLPGEEKAPRELGSIFKEYMRFLDLVRHGECWPPLLPAWGPMKLLLPEEPGRKARAPNESESRARYFAILSFAPMMYKRFCSTAEGRLGWVPDCAQPGDLVCVFDGADVPYVIRPRTEKLPGKFSFAYWQRQLSGVSPPPVEADSDPEYVLVGECYVHGLMDGEALAREDLESKLIPLC